MIRDKNGLTEEEFLRTYDPAKYERPSVTTDLLLFKKENEGISLLLIKRGGHPFLGMWALPGGFVEPNETTVEAARRELREETGMDIIAIRELGCFSNPARDPRTRIITVAYTALLDSDQVPKSGDDAQDAKWFTVTTQVIEHTENRTIYAVHLTTENESIQFTASRQTDPQGLADPFYALIENHDSLAGDHTLILATAIGQRDDLFGV